MTHTPPEIESRWADWLVDRNRSGARAVLILVVIFYPLFGILDYITAPAEWLPVLFTSRGVVTACTVAMFFIIRSDYFRRAWTVVTGVYVLILAAGIALMVFVLGGYSSPYYAGLNLVMITAGLVFVWPRNVSVVIHACVLLSFVLPNALIATSADIVPGIMSLFFMFTTAAIVVVAQTITYSTNREQVTGQIVLENTKLSLERAHEQLLELDRFKSMVFANITHELKTPLAMLLSPLELMIHGDMGRFSEEQQATIRSMYRNALKLLKMIGDILDLSKLAESRIRLNVEQLDLVEYLAGLVAQIQPLAQRKGVELTFEADTESTDVWCDQDRMERVFINLLSNAAKFAPLGGHILVTLTEEDSEVCVSVADDGPGFPPELAERIFERFYQVDMASTRKHGGSGIGLALAHDLVELHGGTLQASSAPGAGATFTVRMRRSSDHFRPDVLEHPPAAPSVTRKPGADDQGLGGWEEQLASRDDFRLLDIAEVTERRVVVRDPDENRRSHTVLVVEDTPDVIRVVHLALRQHFKFMAAQDGEKGLALALEHRPDLIVTDLMMPGIDGLEMTRRLRADERTSTTPIIMLTARGDMEDRLKGLKEGANAYIAKPFSARELLTTARSLLDVQEGAAGKLLAGRMDSLEVVAGGLTHDINNPLNYIKNALGFIKDDTTELQELLSSSAGRELEADEGKRLRRVERRLERMLKTAEVGVERIGGTVALMRRYSREGYARVHSAHDVEQATREVTELLRSTLGRQVAIDIDFADPATIDCIPEEINQLLTNLIQNALEAAPEDGGEVVIRGRREGGDLLLSVRDNGEGMDKETRDRIFTPFFTTKGPDRGMGLGLTIVWRVARSLGGSVAAESAPGQGAEFRVRLPVARLDEAPQ